MMNKIQSVVAVLAVFLSLSLAYAANLTSCVGPSQVTCPPSASACQYWKSKENPKGK